MLWFVSCRWIRPARACRRGDDTGGTSTPCHLQYTEVLCLTQWSFGTGGCAPVAGLSIEV